MGGARPPPAGSQVRGTEGGPIRFMRPAVPLLAFYIAEAGTEGPLASVQVRQLGDGVAETWIIFDEASI
jgi:hypothetical protein